VESPGLHLYQGDRVSPEKGEKRAGMRTRCMERKPRARLELFRQAGKSDETPL